MMKKYPSNLTIEELSEAGKQAAAIAQGSANRLNLLKRIKIAEGKVASNGSKSGVKPQKKTVGMAS